ncbi:MAG: HNH endonuclease [Magnetococcales bacterium]|nr:HNH endonuclease [Magnetococcales bacterium]
MDYLLISVDPDEVDAERRKARELKRSPWWKNQLGKGLCAYCGGRFSPAELTMDHKLPLVRGGKTSRSNCVPACKSCNERKQNHPAQEWKVLLETGGES